MIAPLKRDDSGYEQHRRSVVWNGLVPDRFPAAIYLPREGADVAALLRDQIPAESRVSVRSGGHDWLGASLRDDSCLIDLRHLNQVSIEPSLRTAVVGPGATHKILADALVPAGLGFPIGHCPEVGLGGYLLAGGKSWNQHEWGPGCWNVVGADVVLPDGTPVYIDDESHPELFWGARGGASGFPAIITRFHLRLYDLPAIVGRTVSFPAELLRDLAPWVAATLAARPPGLEMSLIVRRPHPGAAPTANLAATSFGKTEAEARPSLDEALADLPVQACVADTGIRPIQLNDLEGEGGWVRGRRHAADTCWVDDRLAEFGAAVTAAVQVAPSPLSKAVIAFPLAPDDGPATAFTLFSRATVNFYGIWPGSEADAPNRQWVRDSMASVSHLTVGRYIGESDISAGSDRLQGAYPPEKLARLRHLASSYDPQGRMHTFLGHG